MLYVYLTMPHYTIRVTSFRLAYRIEAVILIEVHIPSRRTEAPMNVEENSEALREKIDMVEEVRSGASLKQKIS